MPWAASSSFIMGAHGEVVRITNRNGLRKLMPEVGNSLNEELANANEEKGDSTEERQR
jgi:hypothetical protein